MFKAWVILGKLLPCSEFQFPYLKNEFEKEHSPGWVLRIFFGRRVFSFLSSLRFQRPGFIKAPIQFSNSPLYSLNQSCSFLTDWYDGAPEFIQRILWLKRVRSPCFQCKGAQVWSLIGELSSHMLRGTIKKKSLENNLTESSLHNILIKWHVSGNK